MNQQTLNAVKKEFKGCTRKELIRALAIEVEFNQTMQLVNHDSTGEVKENLLEIKETVKRINESLLNAGEEVNPGISNVFEVKLPLRERIKFLFNNLIKFKLEIYMQGILYQVKLKKVNNNEDSEFVTNQ